MPLSPWVVEGPYSSTADRLHHNYQTEWSVLWEEVGGPLDGDLTDQQHLWLIRNHEAELAGHLQHLAFRVCHI